MRPADAIGTVWTSSSGLYFGLIAPVLIGGVIASIMTPEKLNNNLEWIRSQPGGITFLFQEKIRAIALICAGAAIGHALVVFGFSQINGVGGEHLVGVIALNAACSGIGMFAVASLYLWISTYLDSSATIMSAAVGGTIATMALAVAWVLINGDSGIERFLPTSQIISTSFSRKKGETDPLVIASSLSIAAGWAALFLRLSYQRLSARGVGPKSSR